MKGKMMGPRLFALFLPLLLLCLPVHCDDAQVLNLLKQNITNSASLPWSGTVPCAWKYITCDKLNRVQRIQIKGLNLTGTLPVQLRNLSELTDLEVQDNQFTGPFPTFAGHGSLQTIIAHNNRFASFPADFFTGMRSLQSISIDYNPFSAWTVPATVTDATSLTRFSANNASLVGKVPGFFGTMVSLQELHLAMNNLEGELPSSFSGSGIQSLWLNGQKSNNKLNGTIAVLANMTFLTEVWLHGNQFTGPIPDLSKAKLLQKVSLRDNQLTGIVPASLVNLPNLTVVNLTNNLLQGPEPKFGMKVNLDMAGVNSFCTNVSGGTCDCVLLLCYQLWKASVTQKPLRRVGKETILVLIGGGLYVPIMRF
ncbi:hypothetical protein SLA2020_263020 [Shorea laevis]